MALPASTARLAVLVPLAVVAVDLVRRLFQRRGEKKGYPLPPGPAPLPIIGSALAVNMEEPWLTYTEWRAKYGDIIYLRLMDSDVIILNSPTVANDLLEKRSQIYSDRPFIATVDAYGHDCNFAFARYGDHWRLCRRIFHQTFRAEAALVFRPMQLHRARQMIVNMIDEPNDYPFHFATYAAAVATSALYDYEPTPRNDPIVSIVDNYLQASVPALTPEKSVLIKTFPFLLYVPDWLPGSWIKREAKVAYEWRNKLLDTPYQYVQKRMASGEHMNAAMVPDHIIRMESMDDASRPIYEKGVQEGSVSALIGGTETTSSTLMIFALAMVQNPQVWKRAQAEIDAVAGKDRLPEFDDRSNLPYVEAIIRETLRWRPVVPLCIPHAVTTSDVYKDYYIPKGATVFANAWAMSRDEIRYPDPESFKPERFFNADGTLTEDDPGEFAFGFGRRMCPGRHAAHASLFSTIATMLATLDFNLAKDADGNDVHFTPVFANGITQHPTLFPCGIAPRAHITRQYLERALAQ